jgi:hypothetical protein
MVKKILLVLILLPFLILLFAPKKELLFLLEKRLATQGIVIGDGRVDETPIGLTIEHPVLYYKGIKIATAETISLWSLLLYTHGSIQGIHIDPPVQSYLSKRIEGITLTHSIINPIHVPVNIAGKALAGSGDVNLKSRTLQLQLTHIPKSNTLTRYLKKTKGGWIYEQRF